MRLLALDCSTSACSVALLQDNSGHIDVTESFEMAARQHTQRILPMVESLLGEHRLKLHEIDGIAFGRGPGSFTGLRICVSAVQGLAYGADIPVVGISTLAAQAKLAFDNGVDGSLGVISTLDARMDEIYWAVYQSELGDLKADTQECLSAPENIDISEPEMLVAIGSGHSYIDRIPNGSRIKQWYPDIVPSSKAVVELAYPKFVQGDGAPAASALPVYLREQVAWQKQVPSTTNP